MKHAKTLKLLALSLSTISLVYLTTTSANTNHHSKTNTSLGSQSLHHNKSETAKKAATYHKNYTIHRLWKRFSNKDGYATQEEIDSFFSFFEDEDRIIADPIGGFWSKSTETIGNGNVAYGKNKKARLNLFSDKATTIKEAKSAIQRLLTQQNSQ